MSLLFYFQIYRVKYQNSVALWLLVSVRLSSSNCMPVGIRVWNILFAQLLIVIELLSRLFVRKWQQSIVEISDVFWSTNRGYPALELKLPSLQVLYIYIYIFIIYSLVHDSIGWNEFLLFLACLEFSSSVLLVSSFWFVLCVCNFVFMLC